MTAPRSNTRRLDGMTFGSLTVIEPTDKRAPSSGAVIWRCRCACGSELFAQGGNLASGKTLSCGCVNRARTHGGYETREYQTWENMHQRCSNQRHPKYRRYGGRGIAVCDRWATFDNFISDMGPCPVGLTLERIDNANGYEPGNCKWATYADQNRNTAQNRLVTMDGITLCVQDWCARTGVTQNAVNGRLRKGWTFDRIFATPVATRRHRSTS